MATSESVKKAVAKYQANQEHIKIHVPLGKKAEYKAQADAHGLSLNAYIIKLLEADKAQEQDG